MNKVIHIDQGLADFKQVWDLQKKIHTYKQKHNDFEDVIITCEHPHVYTLGKSGDKDHLLLDENQLKQKKISYYEIDRGGDLTYHGPGQLVCYPILNLNHYYLDTHRFLRDLEETVILVLKDYGIESHKDEQYTGVWVGEEKICAIGIKVSRWVTMHGLAFNVNSDLQFFSNIIPCGIFHKGVTSMKKILGIEMNMNEVKNKMLSSFQNVFKIDIIEEMMPEEIEDKINHPVRQ